MPSREEELRKILEYLLFQSQGGSYRDEDIDQAISAITKHFKDLIERCLVENDSDTHIIAKDLITKLYGGQNDK